ncbi:hypothetical protein ACFLRB_02225 [Acidobacteriota bacterium]
MIDFLETMFIKTWKGWFVLFLLGITVYMYVLWIKEKKERKKTRQNVRTGTGDTGKQKKSVNKRFSKSHSKNDST